MTFSFRSNASCLAAVLAIGISLQPLTAYHHFTIAGTAGPVKWRTLGVNLTVDGTATTPADFLTDAQTAVTTWNGIATAQNVFGTATAAAVDFTGANSGTAWGKLTADGLQEIVYDADGSALAVYGLAAASINGYGPSRRELVGGQPAITDAFLIVTGTRTDFDRPSTMVHELGHIQGLAHSTVGMHNSVSTPSDALDVISVANVPTMHPFGVSGTGRRTPEPDDVASLSELYPEATFATTFGVISGTITRCVTSAAVIGANVRIVNTTNLALQLSRFSSFDGNAAGLYTIRGVPAGSYKVIVEPMGANSFTLNRFGSPPARTDVDFPTEYHSTPATENACTEETPGHSAECRCRRCRQCHGQRHQSRSRDAGVRSG